MTKKIKTVNELPAESLEFTGINGAQFDALIFLQKKSNKNHHYLIPLNEIIKDWIRLYNAEVEGR